MAAPCALVPAWAVVETITNKNIVGPWDLAMTSTATSAQVFISNALGGNVLELFRS